MTERRAFHDDPPVPRTWRCSECCCGSYALVSERKPDGAFRPGQLIRCVECKSLFDTRTAMTSPITPPTTDLAARFEAKREECEEQAENPFDRGSRLFWQGQAAAFAEARDMARAGAAGGAGECCVPDDGEPSFVLLGRDPQAPGLVFLWAHDRARLEPDSPKPAMACEIADQMRAYKLANPDKGLQAAPPPPAQQGSSPPPLTAERVDLPPPLTSLKAMVRERLSEIKETSTGTVDLGELERLSERASPGPWTVSGVRKRVDEPSCIIVDGPRCPGLFAFPTADGKAALEALADARFIAGLVTAYRSGHLVPAFLPAGTGSAEEGTDLGAPAVAQTGWRRTATDGKPRYNGEWGERYLLTWSERTATADINCIDGEWSHGQEIVLTGMDWWCWIDAPPYSDAGSQVPQGATPTPDPVGEAKALLEWQRGSTAPRDGTPIWADLTSDGIRQIRWWTVDQLFDAFGGDPGNYQAGFYEMADPDRESWPTWWLPIEGIAAPPALVTLHASQDQAGEVRS